MILKDMLFAAEVGNPPSGRSRGVLETRGLISMVKYALGQFVSRDGIYQRPYWSPDPIVPISKCYHAIE